MSTAPTRLLNIALRSLTLGSRFVFIFFLARYLSPADVGRYGLFTAAIGYGLYVVGLDFYTYTAREILKVPPAQRGRLLKAQACLSAGLFFALVPVILLVLVWAGWPPLLLWWFAPLLLCEYLNQEIYRLLVGLSRQIAASILLFLRQGSWAIGVLAVMSVSAESRTLDLVMALWGASGVATLALGLWQVRRLRMGGWREPVDLPWLWRGILVSGAFLAATLALRGVQTLDRFWLENVAGIEVVAAYVLFLGVASALLTFLDAGVFAFGYPALIRLHLEGDTAGSRAMLRRMLVQTVLFSAGFGMLSWLVLPHLLDWIGNPVYQNRREMFLILMLAMILNAVGMVPHYGLYAQGRDRPIIFSHLASLGAFGLVTWWLAAILPAGAQEMAVPLGLAAAFLLVLLWKTLALLLPDDAGPASPDTQQEMAHSP